MAKQTSNQRHEVNRAEFLKWKLKVVALTREVAAMKRMLRWYPLKRR